jgi:hypothetical protein
MDRVMPDTNETLAKLTESAIAGSDSALYAAVSPLLLRPWAQGLFAVYLKQGSDYVLYTNKGAAFTDEHRQKLADLGVARVYITKSQLRDFEHYLREHLADILPDESIPLDMRAEAWFHATVSLVNDVLEEKLPRPLKQNKFFQIRQIVRDTIEFFHAPENLRSVTKLISKGFRNYQHSIGTMVLHYCVLQTYNQAGMDVLFRSTLGALLHDVGKPAVPEHILQKKPSAMSVEEREAYRSHPSLGAGLVINLPLELETHHCILFHHEQEDGAGFPSGLPADAIPYYLKVLCLCNVYDGLTRATPWRPAHTPYEALQRIQTRKSAFDRDALKRLIYTLANAEIITPDRPTEL